ncbi:MAG: hypothetical protein LW834_01240 [Cyanobium sp. 49614_E6]|jgi:hypothetical protein|nr:hypothetical protein [Cyanobium sp. 49614_E6]
MALRLQGNGEIAGLDLRFQTPDGVEQSRLRGEILEREVVTELTVEERLARIGLTLAELREALEVTP